MIVQKVLEERLLLRPQIAAADLGLELDLMQQAARSIVEFWASVAGRAERIGYHPSLRNFAIDAQGPISFDTFPPLIGYSRDEMGRLLLRFSRSRLIRTLGPAFPERICAIQDEWYAPAGTILGLVGSAIRLRPADQAPILAWARGFAADELEGVTRAEILTGLDTPPRLPTVWVAMRRLLGLEGQPNV